MSLQVMSPIIGVSVGDPFLLFALGMIVTPRTEIYIRARCVLTGGADSHLEIAS